MKKHYACLICTFLLVCSLPAQESAPSLVAGLTGLVGSRGSIDVEVVSRIISDKQEELRKEAIKRLLRENYKDGSFTFFSFLNQSIVNLFENKNTTATKRKLIENLTNLAMVYGFTEFYLRTSYAMMYNPQLKQVFSLSGPKLVDDNVSSWWQARLINSPTNALSFLSTENITSLSRSGPGLISYADLVQSCYDSIIPNLKLMKHELNTKFNEEFRYLTVNQKNFSSLSSFMLNKLKPYSNDKTNISLNDVLLDMVYDIMLNNRELEKLGFFKLSRETPDEDYLYMNKYLFLMNTANTSRITETTGLSGSTLSSFQNALKQLHDKIVHETDLLIKNYLLVKELMNKEMSISQLVIHYEERREYLHTKADFNLRTDSLITKINQHMKLLKNDTILIRTNTMLRFLKDLKNRKPDNFTDPDIKLFKESAYWIGRQFQSKGIFDSTDDKTADRLYAFIWHSRLKNLEDKINSTGFSYLSKISLTTFSDFMALLTNLGSLDKAGTYEEVFKLVMNAGYLLDDLNNTSVFNTLVGNIEKYATIDLENNKLNIDVETVILTLYEKWCKKAGNDFSFYFSIGLSQSFGGVSLQDSTTAEDDRYNPKNLSLASEKIGIRWKAYNHERIMASLPGGKREKTMLSNCNITLYGSGLLYNITNTITKKGFRYPIFGLSTGLQFFNGLEANLFYCTPVYGNREPLTMIQKNYMIGLSFDIPITDYLNAVRKKRNEEKLEKERKEQQEKEEKANAEAEKVKEKK